MSDYQKLDSRTKHMLQSAESGTEESDTQVGVLIRGRSRFEREQLRLLEADGATIRSVAGDTLSADVPLRALMDVARHAFVLQLQASEPLYPEAGSEPPPFLGDIE